MAFEDNGLSERVKERMNHMCFTQKVLIERSGLKQAFVSHIIHGRTKMVGAPIIFKLADALQCGARWLATGKDA